RLPRGAVGFGALRPADPLLRARRRDGVGCHRSDPAAAALHRHRGDGVIEGGIVTLRPWERADAVFVFEACQDADIQRWTRVPRPYTALDAATFIDRHARAQPEDDGAFFAITRTDNGELLGAISLHRIDWA